MLYWIIQLGLVVDGHHGVDRHPSDPVGNFSAFGQETCQPFEHPQPTAKR